MSKIITFSRYFPAHHPRKGKPTNFVEKIFTSFRETVHFRPNEPTHFYVDPQNLYELNKHLPFNLISDFVKEIGNYSDKFDPKFHTIRAGNRWKVGDKFSPRVWSGKPYRSKQIIIAPDIEVKKVWKFDIENKDVFIDSQIVFDSESGFIEKSKMINAVAFADGLTVENFTAWFQYPKPFSGQIISWNENINY